MVVLAKIRLFLLFSLVVSCAWASEPSQKIIIDHAKKNIVESTAALGQRIKECDQLVSDTELPKISYKALTDMGLSKSDVLKSIAHLSFRNYSECEGSARRDLAYDLGLLDSLETHYGIKNSESKQIADALVYPGANEISVQIIYEQLPESAKNYLEKVVGEKPFSLTKTIESMKLE